jgi:hypothetical protein
LNSFNTSFLSSYLAFYNYLTLKGFLSNYSILDYK